MNGFSEESGIYWCIYDLNFCFCEQSLFVRENGENLPEEFVETDYYTDLNAIEKVHHPVGIVSFTFSTVGVWEILNYETDSEVNGMFIARRCVHKAGLQWRIVFPFGLPRGERVNRTGPCSLQPGYQWLASWSCRWGNGPVEGRSHDFSLLNV